MKTGSSSSKGKEGRSQKKQRFRETISHTCVNVLYMSCMKRDEHVNKVEDKRFGFLLVEIFGDRLVKLQRLRSVSC